MDQHNMTMTWPKDPDIVGRTRQRGKHRPDHGPNDYDVECTNCGWTGVDELDVDCDRCLRLVDSATSTLTPSQFTTPTPYDDSRWTPTDWSSVSDLPDPLVAGLLHPGRWTALVAAAKDGKSMLAVYASIALSEGKDPWTGQKVEPQGVLYLDYEMGEHDMRERIVQCGYDPTALKNWWHFSFPGKLDEVGNASRVQKECLDRNATVVIIDGLNGTVAGTEKDDATWRQLFETTIAPLKKKGVAVLSLDNLGKDKSRSARGSSVKMDKPDAVVELKRKDNGVLLSTTHRRSVDYPDSLGLHVQGMDGVMDLRYRQVNRVWTEGAAEMAQELVDRGVTMNWGRGRIRHEFTDIKCADKLLADALAYAKQHLLP